MELQHARSILFCLRYGIGDVVMETPVLETLRRVAPESRLTVLGAPPAVTLLEGDPRVDDLVGIDRWGLGHRWDEGTAESREAIGRWLDERRFDLCLDAHHAATAVSRVIWSRGIPSCEADEATEEAAVRGGADGVAAIKAAVRQGWGLDVPAGLAPHLPLHRTDRRFAEAFLDDHGIRGGRPIGLSPVASLPMKRWPPARFAEVADWVVEATGRTPLLFCGPQDEAGDETLAAMRHAGRVVRVGALHLRRVAALLDRCDLFICNDTGLMHMASAVATPVIALFGPTTPRVYLPPAPSAVGVGGVEIDCPHRNTASLQPPGCWASSHCLIAEHSCIWKARVGEVLAAARRFLDAPAAGAREQAAGADGDGRFADRRRSPEDALRPVAERGLHRAPAPCRPASSTTT